MVLAIILFFIFRRFLRIGAHLSTSGIRDLFTGFILALISFMAVVAMSVTGAFWPEIRLTLGAGFQRCASATFAAATVGFLEEVFLRGILLEHLSGQTFSTRPFTLCPCSSKHHPGFRPLTRLQTSRTNLRAVFGSPGFFSGALWAIPSRCRVELCLHADRFPLPFHWPACGLGLRH